MTVAEALTVAQQAHARYRALHASTANRDATGLTAAVRDAREALRQAESADPAHSDPAWSGYLAAMKGVEPSALLDFYRRYLGEAVA